MRYFSRILLLLLLFSGLAITTLFEPAQAESENPTGKILFTGRNNGQRNVYLIDIASGEIRALTNMFDAGGPSLSPDNEHVAFTAIDDNGWNVYVVDIDGSNLHALTTESGLFPAWSPDGTSIAFISTRDGRPRLYLTDADGSNQRRLTHIDVSLVLRPAPVWSPNGQQIAVVSTLKDIFVVDRDGSRIVLISRVSSYAPDWSPDGTRIVFSESGPATTWQIRMTNPDGTNPQDLSLGYVDDMSNPTWSPDGRYIAFTSSGWQKASVYVMDADGSNKRLLVDAESWLGPPSWSPDGQHLAFPTTCDGSEQIYIAHLDGTAGYCLATGDVQVASDTTTKITWIP